MRPSAFAGANDPGDRDRAARRAPDGVPVPDRDARPERLHGRRAVARGRPRSRAAPCRSARSVAFLSYLAQILMSVMMATFSDALVPVLGQVGLADFAVVHLGVIGEYPWSAGWWRTSMAVA